jgi:hypothetical protein
MRREVADDIQYARKVCRVALMPLSDCSINIYTSPHGESRLRMPGHDGVAWSLEEGGWSYMHPFIQVGVGFHWLRLQGKYYAHGV